MTLLEAFTYQLNAMEAASRSDDCADYEDKRQAVLAFVGDLAHRVVVAEGKVARAREALRTDA